ncbi:MAG: DNA-binding transcriptional regulator [Bacteroidales bacterium]|nr:DNA-binding transcriptional regulator [Bacteroidales bacterium]
MHKIILLIDFSEEYTKNLLRGITRFSREHGPWVFCRMPTFYRETIGIEGIIKWAKEWGAHGIFGQLYNIPEVGKIIEAGITLIAVDFKERFTGIPNITGGYLEAGRMGADYFLKKGYKNFAFYGFKNIVWSRERALGFEDRINKSGFTVEFFEHKNARSRELWYYKPSSLSNWLKSLPKPVALMACDDNQGQHITEACRFSGIRIPEEVSVLGVDNDETTCALSDPPLSSIVLNTEKAGFEAARLMDLMIRKKSQQEKDIIVEPMQVVTRQSTDIYATHDKYIASALKFIHQNIQASIRVNDVLKQLPLSRRSLEKRFLQMTGLPVYKYIYNLRIEKFAEKLLETDKNITEIAFETGFSDVKNISRRFRALIGCTPNEYRKKHMIGKP